MSSDQPQPTATPKSVVGEQGASLPSLDGLIAALEGATGADREVDAEIARLMLGDGFVVRKFRGSDEGWGITPAPLDWKGSHEPLPRYTSSLDAALALVGEKLPGMETWLLLTVLEASKHRPVPYVPQAETAASWLARRVLIALLKALKEA